jgi:hypothetical protein
MRATRTLRRRESQITAVSMDAVAAKPQQKKKHSPSLEKKWRVSLTRRPSFNAETLHRLDVSDSRGAFFNAAAPETCFGNRSLTTNDVSLRTFRVCGRYGFDNLRALQGRTGVSSPTDKLITPPTPKFAVCVDANFVGATPSRLDKKKLFIAPFECAQFIYSR